jgi:hypothetical protein
MKRQIKINEENQQNKLSLATFKLKLGKKDKGTDFENLTTHNLGHERT